MKILFVNQTYMEWYRGANNFDHPTNGGSWVKEHGDDSADTCNFLPLGTEDMVLPLQLNDGETLTLKGALCIAYISTMRTKDGTPKNLHLEKIRDCQGCTKNNYVDDVLVIFCAKRPGDAWPTIVGWYLHAYVFRYYLDVTGPAGEALYGNIIAQAKDVVLLPQEERKWRVYRASKDGFGFGQSNYWFANEEQSPKVKGYVEDIVKKIDAYQGDNLMDYSLCLNCGSTVPRGVKYCDQCGAKMFRDAASGAVDMGILGFDPFLDVMRLATQDGIPNITVGDLHALWKDAQYTAAAFGLGHGAVAAEDAAEMAMLHLLTITTTTKGLLLIVATNEKALDLQTVKQTEEAVRHMAGKDGEDMTILVGAVKDNDLKGDQARVTLIACE